MYQIDPGETLLNKQFTGAGAGCYQGGEGAGDYCDPGGGLNSLGYPTEGHKHELTEVTKILPSWYAVAYIIRVE